MIVELLYKMSIESPMSFYPIRPNHDSKHSKNVNWPVAKYRPKKEEPKQGKAGNQSGLKRVQYDSRKYQKYNETTKTVSGRN